MHQHRGVTACVYVFASGQLIVSTCAYLGKSAEGMPILLPRPRAAGPQCSNGTGLRESGAYVPEHAQQRRAGHSCHDACCSRAGPVLG